VGGDVTFHLAMFKGISDNGWFLENPWLGAPGVMRLYDFPYCENALFLGVKGLTALTGDPYLAGNLFHLATYLAAAWTSRVRPADHVPPSAPGPGSLAAVGNVGRHLAWRHHPADAASSRTRVEHGPNTAGGTRRAQFAGVRVVSSGNRQRWAPPGPPQDRRPGEATNGRGGGRPDPPREAPAIGTVRRAGRRTGRDRDAGNSTPR
jgi:hypothetical protein